MTTTETAAEVAERLGLTVEQVEAIKAYAPAAGSGVTITAPLWPDAELADRRANGASRRVAETEGLLAAAIARREMASA